MTTTELGEQLQNDIITYIEAYSFNNGFDVDEELVDNLCQLVVDNFNKFDALQNG